MTQFYVGAKIVEAWEQEKDGEPGYAVKYKDGYISWSPKETFEESYYAVGTSRERAEKRLEGAKVGIRGTWM